MTRAIVKVPTALIVPALLLGVAYVLMINLSQVPGAFRVILPYVPYILLAVGAALGWRFNRSRLALTLAMVALGHWLLTLLPARGPDQASETMAYYAAYAVLLPVNLAVFAILRERGMRSLHSGLRAAALLAQPVFVGLVAGSDNWLDSGLTAVFSVHVLGSDLSHWTRLPQLSIILFGAASLVLLGRLLVHGYSPLDSGSFGALVACAAALHTVGESASPTVFFIAAGLMLVVALFEDAYRMAFLDELTGLPGRRALTTEMMGLTGTYSAAMVDIDHFKKFNDTHGHDVGDQVLRMVAGRLGQVGGGGKAFRYGGEEFTILFPGKDKDIALPYLERLRQSIEKSRFQVRGKDRRKRRKTARGKRSGAAQVRVTVSMGVAQRNDKAGTPEAVVKAADQALYRAKKAGRNQVCQ